MVDRPTDLSTGTREINKFVRNPQKQPTCHTSRIELLKGHACRFKDLFVLRTQNSERGNSVNPRRQSSRGGGDGRGVGGWWDQSDNKSPHKRPPKKKNKKTIT